MRSSQTYLTREIGNSCTSPQHLARRSGGESPWLVCPNSLFQTPHRMRCQIMCAQIHTTSSWEDNNSSWNYAKALDLLKKNPPEQRIDFQLPYSRYMKLVESWSRFKVEANILEDPKYPRLSYNPVEQIATVVTIQRALHEMAAVEFGFLITLLVREYLGNHKPDEKRRILTSGSTTRTGTHGKYAKSSNEPDGSFMYADKDHGRVLQLVTEVGFSEHYAALLRDKDMWIQGHDLKAVVLICVKESPRFEKPKAAYEIKNLDVELATMRESNTVMQRNMEGEIYGPIEYHGHRWFGKFSDAFLEVWRADRKDPIRTWLIKDGRLYDPLPMTIGLKISDFFTEDGWAAANIPDSDVRFVTGEYVHILLEGRLATAEERFAEFCKSTVGGDGQE
ncbi:hypothetical protein V1517DRAFT_325615 [Lipomyces orientalis]|uniref:Uncharacterized protein n=1 Tax=Lipomyces orientalis TaxID=1233043 RepID=A0ACC3TNR5_9ASCO